jgi:SAM-dependent methyltransferase
MSNRRLLMSPNNTINTAKLIELLEEEPPGVSQEISSQDLMHRSDPDRYFMLGRAALRCIRVALAAARKEQVGTVLDLPCGHGRVLRMLRAEFPEASLTACDIDRDAVDFCAHALGAIPVYSTQDPSELRMNLSFDLIWCGSLVTHLSRPAWERFLDALSSFLGESGILVITTHGRRVAERIGSRSATLGLTEEKIEALLRDYRSDGFGYVDYPAYDEYGISLSAPDWVCARIQERDNLRLVTYMVESWGTQDVVVCGRT